MTIPVVTEPDRILRECGCPAVEIDRCAHFDGKTLLLWVGKGCALDCTDPESESLPLEGAYADCVVIIYEDVHWDRCSCGGWVPVYGDSHLVYAGSDDDLAAYEFDRAEAALLRDDADKARA